MRLCLPLFSAHQMKRRKKENPGRRVALFGMAVALAMILGYVEFLIPVPVGIPGVKLGLANLVTIVCLYRMGEREAAAVSLARIFLVGFTFGNMSSLLYSLAGGAASYLCMLLSRRSGRFGRTGVSVIGGVTHNLGQLFVASLVVENASLLWYFPVLLAAGTLTGLAIGLLAGEVLKRLPRTAGDPYSGRNL